MHLLLCDGIDAGKSTFVLALVGRLIARGVRPSGWITPAHMEEGHKRGHDFVAIERGVLAAPIPFTRPAPFENSFPFLKYHFNARAFDRAGAIAPAADLFVMDEIGPLELIEERGFRAAMFAAFASAPATLTVVRSGLDERLRLALPRHRLIASSLEGRIDLERSLERLVPA